MLVSKNTAGLFSAKVFTPAFQLKHTRSARKWPSCLCLPIPSSLPRRSICRDGCGILAAGETERKKMSVGLQGETQRCAPVCTPQVSPGGKDTAAIPAKNIVLTLPFQLDWTAMSLWHHSSGKENFHCDKRTLVLTRRWIQQRAAGIPPPLICT